MPSPLEQQGALTQLGCDIGGMVAVPHPMLGIDMQPETWHAARNRLELEMIANAAKPPPIQGAVPLTLEPTNAIFGQAGYPFHQDYLGPLAGSSGAPLHTAGFVADPEAARQAANDWVAAKTRERIPELLAEGEITYLTRFVLANAIYFRAT